MKKRIALLLAASVLMTGCAAKEEESSSVPYPVVDAGSVTTITSATTTTAPEPTEEPLPPEPEFSSVNIVCAGDNLIHQPIYSQAARRAGGEGYDFSYPYQYVAELISEADMAILNQETIVTDEFEPSTYPCFCTPAAMGDEMVELGFDVISVGNNHILDKGEAGLLATLDYWSTNHPDIPVYGAYRNVEDMNNVRTLTVNDITFAFLSYMEHTNGLSLPSSSECELVYLSELELIEQQIRSAAEKYDCVIVSAHFGVETTNTISDSQYYLSQQFADWGADIIVGTQPHTIQSMEWLDKADGGKAFVFYCLGNFLSAQSYVYCMVEMLGRITVTKNLMTGDIELSHPNAVPLVNHYESGYSDIRVYPLSMYTNELANAHGCPELTMDFVEYLVAQNIPEEFLCLE